jgi:hypothetical protein
MPSLLRSFLAILFGFIGMMLVVIVLTLIMVKTMGLKTGHPTAGYLFVNTIYSLMAATIGGYVTAAIARVKQLEHGAVLALVILAMGVYSYRHYTGLQPFWYQVMLQILPPLFAFGGAALFARNAPR